MDYGIGMFLAGLVSGAGIGWYSALMKERAGAAGDLEQLRRKVAYYQGLLYKAGLSVDGGPGDNQV